MTPESNLPIPETEAETAFIPEDAGTSDELPPAPPESLREKFARKKYLLICFFLPAALMWLIYIAMKVYPFGEESVLVLDLNGQYIYYFEALRDLIRGEGSILYSFGRTMGGEFLGIFAYYLASPFSFIVALFPKSMMTEALLVLFLLKTGLCGLHRACGHRCGDHGPRRGLAYRRCRPSADHRRIRPGSGVSAGGSVLHAVLFQ